MAAQDHTGLREAVARIIALAGLGSSSGRDRVDPPHDGWAPEEWQARILECIPGAAFGRCLRLADAILALPQLATLSGGGEGEAWEVHYDERTCVTEIRTALDGDVDSDTGQHVVVGGNLIATIADNSEAEAYAELIASAPTLSASLSTSAALVKELVEALEDATNSYVRLLHATSREGHCDSAEDSVNVKRWRAALSRTKEAGR